MSSPAVVPSPGRFVGRSLFPLVALLLVASAAWFGPYVGFGLAYAWWRVIARIA